jgi:hypothetical protein
VSIVDSGVKKVVEVGASRASHTRNKFICITLKERDRAHPNMVSVQDCSRESSSIDRLEVDIGDRPWPPALFFLAGLRSQNFFALTSSS